MTLNYVKVMQAEKTVSLGADWTQDEVGRLRLTLPVDVGSETVEGLVLRVTARRTMPDKNVMFQLSHQRPFTKEEQICRIDWRPIKPHNNHGRGPAGFRLKKIIGSHHHRFDLNWLEEEGKLRANNLPVAVPIDPDPLGFPQLLDIVSKEFRITNIGGLQVPPWDLML